METGSLVLFTDKVAFSLQPASPPVLDSAGVVTVTSWRAKSWNSIKGNSVPRRANRLLSEDY